MGDERRAFARLEIGPKDIENGQCVLVRRDNREKGLHKAGRPGGRHPRSAGRAGQSLYARAEANRAGRTWTATTMDEVLERAGGENGYIKTMWCGNLACEEMMKEKAGLSSRCMPFAQEHLSDVCPCCGKPAKAMVVWGKAY